MAANCQNDRCAFTQRLTLRLFHWRRVTVLIDRRRLDGVDLLRVRRQWRRVFSLQPPSSGVKLRLKTTTSNYCNNSPLRQKLISRLLTRHKKLCGREGADLKKKQIKGGQVGGCDSPPCCP